MGPPKRLKKQPVLDKSSGGRLAKLQTEVVQADAAIGILSVYDLVHVFSFLKTRDKVSVAQVCRKWKQIVYSKCLWKRWDDVYVSCTSSMEVAAPSYVERGINQMTVCDGLRPPRSPDSPQGNASTSRRRSSRLLSLQFCHFTRIMAPSISRLHLYIVCPEGNMMLQKAFNVQMPNLSYLGFSYVNVTKKTIETISKNCPSVENIALIGSQIDNDGLSHIASNLRQLTVLALAHSRTTSFTDEGVAFLATLPKLSELVFIGCINITPACIEILSNAGTPLKVLQLKYSSIAGDLALELVGRSQLTLTELHVGNNKSATTDAGINALLSHGHRHYEHLEIWGKSDISRDGMILLAKRLDNLRCLKICVEDKTEYAKKAAATESS